MLGSTGLGSRSSAHKGHWSWRKISATEQEILKKDDVSSAFEVSEDHTYAFLSSRAGSFASLGVERS